MQISYQSTGASSAISGHNGAQSSCADLTQGFDARKAFVLQKFEIDAYLLESVQAKLSEIRPYLLSYCEYTWQELLGCDFWSDLDVPRHLALLCLQHLAQQPGSGLTISPFSNDDTTFFEKA